MMPHVVSAEGSMRRVLFPASLTVPYPMRSATAMYEGVRHVWQMTCRQGNSTDDCEIARAILITFRVAHQR